MPNILGSLLFQIEANSAKFNSELEKAGAKFSQFNKRVESGVKLLKIAFAAVAASKFVGFLDDALKAQAAQEAAVNKLNLALANQGKLTAETSKSLQDYASALQATTTFGDEAILDAEALLASFGQNEEQIKATTAAALDFAAATGTDLTAAVNLLGRAFVGETGSLTRYGVVIQDGLSKTEKFGAVLQQLNQRFGGQAVAQAATYTGQLEQLKNAFGDAQEGLGKFVGELLGAQGKPFQGLIDFANRLNKLFAFDLIIALGEARAKFAEFVASVLELAAKVGPVFEKIGLIPKGNTETLKVMAEGQRKLASELRQTSTDAALATGKLQTYTNAAGETVPVNEEAAKAAKKHAEAIKSLADEASGAKLEEQLRNISEALQQVTESGRHVLEDTAQQWQDAIKKALDEGLEVPASLREFYSQRIADQLSELIAKAVANTKLKTGTTEALWSKVLGDSAGGGVGASKAVQDMVAAFEEGNKAIQAGLENNKDLTTDWGAALGELRNTFEVLGISADSALGRIAGALAAAFAGTQSLTEAFKEAGAGFGHFDFSKLDFSKVLTGLTQVIGAFKQATNSASGFQRALGGATVGAKAGGAAGGIIGAIFGGPAGAVLGKKIGTIAGGIIGAIGGIFRKPGWKKAATEAGKIFGDELGKSVSEALAKKIEKTAKDLGISLASAALLNINEVMAESSATAVAFADEMAQLMSGIANGSIPAEQGIEALGAAFGKLREEAEAGSFEAMQAMGLLAQQARALGVEVPEIAAAVREGIEKAAEGTASLIENIKVTTEQGALEQATIFSAVFWAKVEQDGTVAAVKAMEPTFAALEKKLREAGLGGAALDAILGPMRQQFSLVKNEATKAAVEGLDALKQIFEGLTQAGAVDLTTFSALQGQAKAAFDQLIAGGADTKAALMAIAPLLADMQKQAAALGTSLDPATQALIDQAEAAGIAFPTDPMTQMVDLLKAIAQALGAEIPASAQAAAAAADGVGDAAAAAAGGVATSLDAVDGAFAGMEAAALEARGTLGTAFDGVGDDISDSVISATDQIVGEFDEAWKLASDGIDGIVAELQRLDGTKIDIPINFSSLGKLPGGDEIPAFQHGGVIDAGPGSLAILHGREAIIPLDRPGQPIGQTTVNVYPSPGMDERLLAEHVVRIQRRNTAGAQTQNRRGYR